MSSVRSRPLDTERTPASKRNVRQVMFVNLFLRGFVRTGEDFYIYALIAIFVNADRIFLLSPLLNPFRVFPIDFL